MTPIRVSDRYPKEHERVLFFDAVSEDWYVGWNAYWHSAGSKARPGKWVIPCGDTDGMQVTHWLPCPENPSNLTDSRPEPAAGSGTADPRVGHSEETTQ